MDGVVDGPVKNAVICWDAGSKCGADVTAVEAFRSILHFGIHQSNRVQSLSEYLTSHLRLYHPVAGLLAVLLQATAAFQIGSSSSSDVEPMTTVTNPTG